MTRRLRRAALAVALSAAGFVGGLYVDSRPDDVFCPTDDSCTADYDGRTDRWIITPVEP